MKQILPQALAPLSEQDRLALVKIFDQDPHKKYDRVGRVRGHNLQPAIDIVRPIIDDLLGAGDWRVEGGIFFETIYGYRVHVDTEKRGPQHVWQTIVFPLRQTLTPESQIEKNRLIIFDQTWSKDAAFFLKGSPDDPKEFNNVIKDYKDVEGLIPGYIDPFVEQLCPHLDQENFEGLTVDQTFQWTPGVPLTFPRNRLHASSAFHEFGITNKLGLSLFFGPR
jgi:hypothetical protein